MHITVGICTWNRADLLRCALETLCQLTIPTGVTWELLVVNNRCTDQTDAVLAEFGARLPLRRIFEPVQGVANARNRVVQEAAGDLLVWTDDDQLVAPNWLAEYAAAAQRHPNAAFFGGPIQPQFEVPPPAWLRAAFHEVAQVFGFVDGPAVECPFDLHFQPNGGNSAVRTAILRNFGYGSQLGRNAGQLLGGEESKLFLQLFAAGQTGWWVPGAPLRHFIPRTRMSLAHLRAYMLGDGRTRAMVFPSPTPPTRSRRSRLWWQALRLEGAYQVGRLFLPPERRMALLKRASICWGEWQELNNQARRAREGQTRAELEGLATPLRLTRTNVLAPGAILRPGECRRSSNGCRLEMQTDGNLVLRHHTQALWATNTTGVRDACCVLQYDGNLVVYGKGHVPVWAANTCRPGLAWVELVVQDDHNLVLYQNGQAVWDRHGHRTAVPQRSQREEPVRGRWRLHQGVASNVDEQSTNVAKLKVVIGLTTTPTRIHAILPTLNSLLWQSRPADRIILSVPATLARTGEQFGPIPREVQELAAAGKLELVRTADYGPATKFIGAALAETDPKAFILWCDDDILYGHRLVETLLTQCARRPGTALGTFGLNLGNDASCDLVVADGAPAEILEGFAGVICRRKDLPDLSLWPALTPAEFRAADKATMAAFLADDFTMSHGLQRKGIQTLVCSTPWHNRDNGFVPRDIGYRADALNQNTKTGGNLKAYALLKALSKTRR